MTGDPGGRHEEPRSLFGWGDPPDWAIRLIQMVQQVLNNQKKILTNQGVAMSLTTDLQDQVASIQTTAHELVGEGGVIIAALNDLAAKAKNTGSVSDADVQAAVTAANEANTQLQGQLAALHSAVQATDPSVEPPPAA